MTSPEELDVLQERLLSRDKSRHGYSGHPRYNRDGPEASDAITALRARVAELEAQAAEKDEQLQFAMMTGHDLAKEEYREKLQAAEAELARWGQGVPLTANVLADAFDAMWNAALGVAIERQEGIAVASMLAEGFAAMGRHLRESAALVSPGDGWRPTHRHKKRGGTYLEIGRGKLQTDTPLTDYAELVVYRAEDGTIWVRPVSEFDDGRFERIASEGADHG